MWCCSQRLAWHQLKTPGWSLDGWIQTAVLYSSYRFSGMQAAIHRRLHVMPGSGQIDVMLSNLNGCSSCGHCRHIPWYIPHITHMFMLAVDWIHIYSCRDNGEMIISRRCVEKNLSISKDSLVLWYWLLCVALQSHKFKCLTIVNHFQLYKWIPLQNNL